MKQTQKALILSIVAIAALVALIVGATFAYFQARGGTSSSVNINVGTATTDMLTFSTGKDISIEANQANFAKDKDSLSASTSATATLTANNSSNSATYNYYAFLNISGNSFIYSQNESTPELILTVIGPDGKEITSLSGLNYATVTDNKGTNISGFDVTIKKGQIVLANNREIVAGTSSAAGKTTTEEKWTVKLTFINYNADQRANAGHSVDAEIIIKTGSNFTSLADLCSTDTNLASCITKFSSLSEPIVSKLYYHSSSLENGAGDNSYRYAGASGSSAYYSCTYDGKEVVSFDTNEANTSSKGDCSKVYKIVAGENTGYYDKSFEKYFYNTTSVKWDSENSICVTESGASVYDYSSNPITEQSMCTGSAYQYQDEEMYIMGITEVGAGKETFVSAASEDEVKNYVCFGSDAKTCPTDNLYRIIGVFGNQVKLIKNESLGSMKWDSNGTNTWSTASLNTYLNETYLNTLGDYANMIATTTWKVGGNTAANIRNAVPATAYQNEVVNPVTNTTDNTTTYSAKIGLMYVSDYGFAADSSAWSTTLGSYSSYQSSNWLSLGSEEWTISRNEMEEDSWYSGSSVDSAFGIDSSGDIRYYVSGTGLDVRPVFYIASATYLSGDGSLENPIRLS